MSKLYDIHPWKVRFVDPSMEEAYQDKQFNRLRKGLIVMSILFSTVIIQQIYQSVFPFPEWIEMKHETGYDHVKYFLIPAIITHTTFVLFFFLGIVGWEPIKKHFSLISLFFGSLFCTYSFLIRPFIMPESVFEYYKASEQNTYPLFMCIPTLPILNLLVPFTFPQYLAALYWPTSLIIFICAFFFPSVLFITVLLFFICATALVYIKYRMEKDRRFQFGRIHEVEQELKEARQMQSSLVPLAPPNLTAFQVAGRSIEAREVGGDFFNYFVEENKLTIAVADVSGKGLKAAMNAVMASGVLSLTNQYQEETKTIMADLNITLCASMENGMNITMVLAEFDLENKQLILANAGQHAYPLLVRQKQIQLIQAKGLALGMIPSIPYKTVTVDLQAGDLLLFMTDGITEPINEAGQMYEESGRFHQLISGLSEQLTAEKVVDQVIGDVLAYMVDEDERDDDITLVAVKVA